jgi:glutaredoxin
MKPTRVRLFIKPYCPWCSKAQDWLDVRGIPLPFQASLS